MGPQHTSKDCRSNPMCCSCRTQGHVAPTCPKYIEALASNKKKAAETNSRNGSSKPGTFLQTFACKVLLKGQETIVRGILDGGSDVSYILEDVLHQLGVGVNPNTVLSVQKFGSSKRTATITELISVALGNFRDQQRTCSLFSTKCITGALCLGLPPDIASEALPDNFQFADHLFSEEQHPIEILIGGDNYYRFVKLNKHKKLTDSLLLLNTLFGWIPAGEVPATRKTELIASSTLQTNQVDPPEDFTEEIKFL